MKNYLGIDLGGTNTKIGIGTMDGSLLHKGSVKTLSELGPQAWVERVVTLVKSWNTEFAAVGVGSPGPLDTSKGVIITSPNLKPFIGFEMKPAFESVLGKSVRFENDANCAGLGEYYFGAHKGHTNTVVITLGTGVGSGIVAEGRLVRGHKGFATELGHMVVNFEGPQCGCGKRGCLEAYVGARKTIERYNQMTSRPEPNITMKEIFSRALHDPRAPANKHAVHILDEWIHALAVGLANTMVIFNPGVIILSGGITDAWTHVKPRLLAALEPMVEPYLRSSTLIEISKLGQYFGVHGAIALASEGVS